MPTKAKLVTRSATSSSVSADNLGKGSELTFNELDSNLINLRDASIGFASDDSTTTSLTMGDTLKIAGGTGITTAVSGDTLTITSSGGSLGDLTATGSTIQSPSNADITLEPGGTGDIHLKTDSNSDVKIGEVTSNNYFSFLPGSGIFRWNSSGSTDLSISHNNGGSVTISEAGGTGAITIAPTTTNATIFGSGSHNATLTSNGAHDLILNTNSGTNAGSITLTDGANGDITIACNGTGEIVANSPVSVASTLAVTGASTLGGISIDDNEIATTASNANLELKTSGSGNVTMSRAEITGGTITGITDLAVADGGTGASSFTANEILRGNGTNQITTNSSLTFDGSTLAVTGAATVSTTLGVTGASTLDGIIVEDHTIRTHRSNDNLILSTAGSGVIHTLDSIIGIGDQTGGNIILTDQADGDFQTSSGGSPGMLNPSGLQVDSAGSFHYSQLILNNFSTNAHNALWTTRSRSNTHGTNAYLNSGDVIFQFFSAGWNGDVDGTGYFSANAQVDMFASENHSATNRGGGINMQTINTGSASGATTKLEIMDNVVVKNPKSGDALTVTGGAGIDFVQISGNEITTNASNADLEISANGTGQIQLSPNGATVDAVFSDNGRYDFGANRIFSEQDADANSIFSSSADRRYSNGDFVSVSLASSSSNSHARWRSGTFSLIDMKGHSITSSAKYFKGIVTRYAENMVENSNTSTASTLNNVTGMYSSLNTQGTDNGGGLTITSGYGFVSDIFLGEGTSETVAMTNAYYNSVQGSSGGGAITNEYAYHIEDSLSGTNKYAFWDESNSLSMFGAVILQNQSGDPSGVTDTSHIYAKDDGGSSEVHVRDEAGNVTKISPHNQQGEWEFYSKNTKTGKTVRINMERAIQVLEKLSGEKLIEGE